MEGGRDGGRERWMDGGRESMYACMLAFMYVRDVCVCVCVCARARCKTQ